MAHTMGSTCLAAALHSRCSAHTLWPHLWDEQQALELHVALSLEVHPLERLIVILHVAHHGGCTGCNRAPTAAVAPPPRFRHMAQHTPC